MNESANAPVPSACGPMAGMPLYVDLDDTLTVGDSLWDIAARLMTARPWSLFAMAGAMLAGRPSFKRYVSANTPLSPAGLTYRDDVIEYVTQQRAAGRRVVMATGAHRLWAERVAAHLGLFDAVIATEGKANMTRHTKLAAIRADCGGAAFEYIGDSPTDLPVWDAAAKAVIIAPSDELLARLKVMHASPLVRGERVERRLLEPIMKGLHEPVYESRIAKLTEAIVPHLRPGDRLLDVGCGFGTLARSLQENGPRGVEVRGLESVPREGAVIEVDRYDGVRFPYDDGAFDVVTIADVLHHEHQPERLLAECIRVSSRAVIVKDHCRSGVLAQQRISLIDWAAHAPYGVPCLYRYLTHREWVELPRRLGVMLEAECWPMPLYPMFYEKLFGGRLQYLAVWRVSD